MTGRRKAARVWAGDALETPAGTWILGRFYSLSSLRGPALYVKGYIDGFDLSPPIRAGRSRAYRDGFADGRHDRGAEPRARDERPVRWADEAAKEDAHV